MSDHCTSSSGGQAPPTLAKKSQFIGRFEAESESLIPGTRLPQALLNAVLFSANGRLARAQFLYNTSD